MIFLLHQLSNFLRHIKFFLMINERYYSLNPVNGVNGVNGVNDGI